METSLQPDVVQEAVAGVLDDRVVAILQEALSAIGNNDVLTERIEELELHLEDVGWEALSGFGEDYQFSRDAIDKIIRLSRLYYLKNPIIKRPVNLQAYYVWGQGYSVAAESPFDKIVKKFLSDPSNKAALTGQEACMDNERKLRCEGNLFLAFYIKSSTGRTQVRRLKVDEMRSIIYDPSDDSKPRFYKRRWVKMSEDGVESVEKYYPDWNYVRELRAEEALALDNSSSGSTDELTQGRQTHVTEKGGKKVPIDWNVPVLHKKVGAFSDMDFGVPETYAALDWARAYKELLEDFKKTVKSLAKWAWQLKKDGANQNQINAIQSQLQSVIGEGGALSNTNPAPTTGSAFVSNDLVDLKTIDVSKATIDPKQFRFVLLQACAAMDTPLNFYGDSDAGNLAAAKTLDRPSELGFRSRQGMWEQVLIDVLTVAVEAAAVAPGNTDLSMDGYDEETGLMRFRKKSKGKRVEFEPEVTFPPVLQQDTQSVVQSLVTGLTLNGQPIQLMNDGPTIIRLLLTALNVEGVDDIVEVFYPKDGSESTAKPIVTFTTPDAPGDVPPSQSKPTVDGTLTPAQQAAQKNEKTKPGKITGPPQSPETTR